MKAFTATVYSALLLLSGCGPGRGYSDPAGALSLNGRFKVSIRPLDAESFQSQDRSIATKVPFNLAIRVERTDGKDLVFNAENRPDLERIVGRFAFGAMDERSIYLVDRGKKKIHPGLVHMEPTFALDRSRTFLAYFDLPAAPGDGVLQGLDLVLADFVVSTGIMKWKAKDIPNL